MKKSYTYSAKSTFMQHISLPQKNSVNERGENNDEIRSVISDLVRENRFPRTVKRTDKQLVVRIVCPRKQELEK